MLLVCSAHFIAEGSLLSPGRCAVFCLDLNAQRPNLAEPVAYTCKDDLAHADCNNTAFAVLPRCPYDVQWEEHASCSTVAKSRDAPLPHANVPCYQEDMSYSDTSVKSVNGAYQANAHTCQTLCKNTPSCSYFTFWRRSKGCWLLGPHAKLQRGKVGAISGPKACPPQTTAAPRSGPVSAPALGLADAALRGGSEATTPSPVKGWVEQVATAGASSLVLVSWRIRMIIALSIAGFGLLCVAGICGSRLYKTRKKRKPKKKKGRKGVYVEHYEEDLGIPCRETTTESSMPLMDQLPAYAQQLEPAPGPSFPQIGLAPPVLPAPVLPAVQPVFM